MIAYFRLISDVLAFYISHVASPLLKPFFADTVWEFFLPLIFVRSANDTCNTQNHTHEPNTQRWWGWSLRELFKVMQIFLGILHECFVAQQCTIPSLGYFIIPITHICQPRCKRSARRDCFEMMLVPIVSHTRLNFSTLQHCSILPIAILEFYIMVRLESCRIASKITERCQPAIRKKCSVGRSS